MAVAKIAGMRSRMWFCAMLSVGLLCGSYVLTAQTLADQAPVNQMGEWVMRLGHRTMFVLSIHPAKKAGQACAGSFARPQHFQTADAISFNHVSGPTEMEAIVACESKSGGLSFTVENPTDASDKDTYQLLVRDGTHADLQLEGLPLGPMKLERTTGVTSVSTDWEQSRSYSPEDDAPSNPEMKRIFDEDQRARQTGVKTDWAEVNRLDAERRDATRKLLKDGALHSGQDFGWAAFVFQHGSTPDDYLLAHTLAIVALKKGDQDSVWIATATLDRYLQSINQPQIYGTQFRSLKGEATTQDPYNRTLISDSLRRQLGVPSIDQQQGQLKQWNKERGIQ